MKAHTANWTQHDYNRKARIIANARPGAEKACQVVDLVAKVFTAGVPAIHGGANA